MKTAQRVKSTLGDASLENQSGASDNVSLPRNLHITTGKDRAIEISGLHFYWKSPTAPVLDIESLWVNKGQSIFIEGPSGSGKSTLLSLVAGVLTPQQGDVIVLGHRLNALNSAQRDHFRSNHVGVIFQMFNLIPYLSVVENVLLPCRFSRLRRDKALRRGDGLEAEARRLLAHLDMDYPALLSCPVTELSVGQQQRVAAARALIGAPEIVIADEPTSSLDAEYRHSFMQLLFEECQQAQATLIFVSHDTSMTSLFDRHVRLSEINRADQVATRRIPGGA
jgi:putative ABC transport system ATP-binding protein